MSVDKRALLELCRECGATVFDRAAPNTKYAEATARLLFGTAATESHFRYRRQTVFDWGRNIGAWGLFQTEQGSVESGLNMLRTRPALAASAARFVFQQAGADISPILGNEIMHAAAKAVGGAHPLVGELRGQHSSNLLRVISGWDRLACLFARLHYMRVPAPIPLDLHGQAEYWKRYYNTHAGKGTPMKYLADWKSLAEPYVDGLRQ